MRKLALTIVCCLIVFAGCCVEYSHPVSSQPYVIVGSRNSDVYHYSYCPSARSIFPENLIIFQDERTAQLLGRRLADPCFLYKRKWRK